MRPAVRIGARLDDRATGKLDGFAPNAKMIHIDAMPPRSINSGRPTWRCAAT